MTGEMMARVLPVLQSSRVRVITPLPSLGSGLITFSAVHLSESLCLIASNSISPHLPGSKGYMDANRIA